uniref:Uncharacterized protein n=1 Tax=Meloidogyne javanica TaxID=6303 RepID=A0A915LJS1_MELJA
MDCVTFELNIPVNMTGIVTKELSCGFFDWTFSFFLNDENNSSNFFKTDGNHPNPKKAAKGYLRRKRKLKKLLMVGGRLRRSKLFGKAQNGIHNKPAVFSSLLPAAPIRCYSSKRFRKSQTLIVHMWVNKIKTIGLVPPLKFDKELPNKLSVCLRCGKEFFHVSKIKLAMFSLVFRQKIFDEKLGDDLKNPIKI